MMDDDRRVLKVAQELLSGTTTCKAAALELTLLGRVSPGCQKLAHFLFHYVADEDVRRRDKDYAQWQQEQLHRLIAEVNL